MTICQRHVVKLAETSMKSFKHHQMSIAVGCSHHGEARTVGMDFTCKCTATESASSSSYRVQRAADDALHGLSAARTGRCLHPPYMHSSIHAFLIHLSAHLSAHHHLTADCDGLQGAYFRQPITHRLRHAPSIVLSSSRSCHLLIHLCYMHYSYRRCVYS
jgi:hypothetical protein